MRNKTKDHPWPLSKLPVHTGRPRIRFLNLGCPKNLVDAEVMLGHLSSAGYQICTDKELADNTRINYDIFIINTCCFIKEAEDESRDIIQKAIDIKDKADIKIIVSGCLAQRYAGQLYKEFDREIDGIMGLSERDKIVQLCTNLLKDNRYQKYRRTSKDGCRLDGERLRITPQHYAYLRIAEGCDNRCSYCIIPDIHGPYRSKPLDAIIEEAIFLVSQGTKEINLIAQDTTSYGKDFRSSVSLSALLKELAKIKDLEWIRLLYTHPAHFTDELIDTISQLDKVVKYIDLPIQHISNNILSLMGRHISSDGIKRLISKIREKIPDVFIRTTVIVGFPGETESDFKKLLDFIREIEFERLGAFQYSREKNTPAYRLDKQLPITVKEKRLDSIMSLQQKIAFRKNESLINKSLSTIIDEPYKDMVYSQQNQDKIYLGRTYGDAPEVDGNIIIKTNANRGLSVGDIIRVKVTGTEHYDLVGEL